VNTADNIVVIGASAGGVRALSKLLARFEVDWPVSVFITLHTGKNRSLMPDILNKYSPLLATFAEHQKTFGRGIYFAPPDRHLIIGHRSTFLSPGPTENHSRPAIDPMFRSAAQHHGPNVIGVLLTGYLFDGVHGLYQVQQYGGTTIVQDPTDAEIPEIPRNALSRLKPDYVAPLADIPDVIEQRLNGRPRAKRRVGDND
jgi:two-component system, chemotaxis family, protein-glutamate methylesterase/glutaminase